MTEDINPAATQPHAAFGPRMRRFGALAPLLLLVLSAILMAIGAGLAPGFASVENVLQLLKLSAFAGLAAIGQTIVMLVGGIDLSVAWVLTGSATVFTAVCDGKDANILPAAAAALGLGAACGLINGVGIVRFSISPLVMTLAMNNIMLGATLIFTGGTPSGSVAPIIRELAVGTIGPVPTMVLVWVLLAGLTILVLKMTRTGRRVLAVGESRRVSYLSGIDNDRIVIGCYVLCGLTASLTGILFAAFSGASFLGMGDQFVLPTIAAVVLGGTSMFGGRGGYGGTMAAVFFTTILTTVLVIARIPVGVRYIVFGVAVLVAIILQRLMSQRGATEE